ncbi:hypothetical protein BGY98DRAFT_539560 [Russula aff. rugulosa BPL654]|nr:hypothetical protein BGY98DRAFT_539560 [Russula aff. rugulosa BPL654]
MPSVSPSRPPSLSVALSAMQMVLTTYLVFALIASSGPACEPGEDSITYVHLLEDAHATTETHDSAETRVPR